MLEGIYMSQKKHLQLSIQKLIFPSNDKHAQKTC